MSEILPARSSIRREGIHIAAVLLAVLAARALLFEHVGIWGDAGFYVYDARMINDGQTPFVDFIGRSPMFNYSYAFVASLFGNTMLVLRSFISLWWVLCLFPAYYLSRRIHSHASGIATMALLGLSPFMLVYGFWANTQSMAAFFAITALAVIVWRERPATYAVAGVCLGIAFLARRSIIVVVGAIGLWAGYQFLQAARRPESDDQKADRLAREVSRHATRLTSLAVGFFAALVSTYALMARGDVGLTLALAETHAWGLLSSSGRGGFPLVTDTPTPPVTNTIEDGRIPIFNDVCQMCGAWTARTFAKTLLVTVPLAGPVMVYLRDMSDRYFTDAIADYTFGILLLLAGYAAVVATLAGYEVRVLAIVSLALFGILAFRANAISRLILYERHMMLMWLVLAGFAAGYLYRNRVLHTYYFLDFMPALAVVVGVLYVELWRRL